MSAASDLLGTTPATPATPSTPAATPSVAAPVAPATPAPEHWTSTVQDEGVRGWAQLRGWKDAGDALKAHKELESLRGVPADRLLKLPEKDDAEGWKAVQRRLGAPENPEGYELPKVEVPPGEVDLAADFRTWAHTNGLTQAQAKGIYDQFVSRSAEIVEQQESQRIERSAAELGELKKAWGQEYNANLMAGKMAAQKLGMKEAELSALEDAIGARRTMELFARIGNGIAEFKSGREDVSPAMPFGMTPDAARAQIAQLKADHAFMDKTLIPGSQERARIENLYRIAAG